MINYNNKKHRAVDLRVYLDIPEIKDKLSRLVFKGTFFKFFEITVCFLGKLVHTGESSFSASVMVNCMNSTYIPSSTVVKLCMTP